VYILHRSLKYTWILFVGTKKIIILFMNSYNVINNVHHQSKHHSTRTVSAETILN